MGLINDFYITTQAGNEPCTIEVKDITTYPYHSGAITTWACALFYDTAAFAGPTYSGGSLQNLNQYGTHNIWTIPPLGNVTVDIQVFVVQIWTVPIGTYPIDYICFYNGEFWHANVVTAGVPGVSVDWDLITVGTPADLTQAYTWFAAFCIPIGAGGKGGYVSTRYDVDCSNNYTPTLVKKSCYHYTMEDISGNGFVQTVTVTAYGDSTLLVGGTLDPSVSTILDLDLSAFGDGVYVVQVIWLDALFNRHIAYFYIYEWCGLWACYQRLLQAVMCGTYNPCCNTCDPALIETNRRYRETLNMMTAFVFSIMAYINVEQVRYLGVFGQDDLQDTYIHRVADMIAEAKSISQACGVCNPTSEEGSVDSPCANCN